MNDSLLLSLCIPTYNRADFLNISLSKLSIQFFNLRNPHMLELIVSDNCSTDNTEKVVNQYISMGLPIKYIKNSKNLGMDGNFVQCFQLASAKYVWLLGDDDFLKDNMLDKLLQSLSEDIEYGLIHLAISKQKKEFEKLYKDSHLFLSDISFWITYISSNVVNTKYVSKINFTKYMGTYFTLIPLYMTAALNENYNLMIHDRIFEDGVDTKRNGGYNFFQVFVSNYLSIWKEFIPTKGIINWNYELEKYRLFRYYLVGNIDNILIKKNKGNYIVDNSWKILFKYYGITPYFYYYLFILFYRKIINKAHETFSNCNFILS